MTRLACEFGVSIATVYNYIEEVRKQLREATIDLAAQEREQSLALIDTAIEQVMPHINGEVKIETRLSVPAKTAASAPSSLPWRSGKRG